jgi:hypothetical protein
MTLSALLAGGLILKVPTEKRFLCKSGTVAPLPRQGRSARGAGISAEAADRHVQNAYARTGVSTRAAAARFAVEHDFVAWGEPPMDGATGRS